MANGAASPLRRPAPERGLVNWFRVQASEPRNGSPSQELLARADPGLPAGQPTASRRPSRQRDRRGPRSLRTRSPPVGAALRVRIPKPGDVSHTPARPLALLGPFLSQPSCHAALAHHTALRLPLATRRRVWPVAYLGARGGAYSSAALLCGTRVCCVRPLFPF